jgi:hypothetical protein
MKSPTEPKKYVLTFYPSEKLKAGAAKTVLRQKAKARLKKSGANNRKINVIALSSH